MVTRRQAGAQRDPRPAEAAAVQACPLPGAGDGGSRNSQSPEDGPDSRGPQEHSELKWGMPGSWDTAVPLGHQRTPVLRGPGPDR